MTTRVILHVGAPKSGTTYLQQILRQNASSLRDQGVLVAGRTHTELVHASFVLREDRRLDALPARAAGAWDRIVSDVRSFEGHTAVISYELLAGARRAQARRAVESFPDCEVVVVITCRDLGRAVSSAWQERLKFALTTPLEEWEPRPVDSGPRSEWSWRTMNPAAVAGRWGATLPASQVRIVTVPRVADPPTRLWERFAAATGLEDLDLSLDVPSGNESLGVRAAEVLRLVNGQDLGPIDSAREQSRWLRDTLAHQVLSGLDDEPMTITDPQLAEAQRQADDAIATIKRRGWPVYGDLGDIEATRRDGRLPGDVPPEELLDVAVRTIVALLLEVRTHQRRHGRSDSDTATSRVGRLIGSRRTVRELTARVAELEAQIAADRALHERVAALEDMVAEILLPIDDRDDDAMRAALRRYRKASL